jgi:hypothetical protein
MSAEVVICQMRLPFGFEVSPGLLCRRGLFRQRCDPLWWMLRLMYAFLAEAERYYRHCRRYGEMMAAKDLREGLSIQITLETWLFRRSSRRPRSSISLLRILRATLAEFTLMEYMAASTQRRRWIVAELVHILYLYQHDHNLPLLHRLMGRT